MGEEPEVEFFYDLVSPYSYLAGTRVFGLCEEYGARLVLRPMMLGVVQVEAGVRASLEAPSKRRYLGRDVLRWAGRYGVPLRFPDPFPFRTLKTMRVAVWLRDRGDREGLERFTREAFRLYWEEGKAPKSMDEADEDRTLAEVADAAGADARELLEGASLPETKQGLKEATGEALSRGVFGAPTFFVGGEMYWGNDRLSFVEEALGGRTIGRTGSERSTL